MVGVAVRAPGRARPGVSLLLGVAVITVGLGPPSGDAPHHATIDVRAVADDPSRSAAGDWVPWLEGETGLPYRLLDPAVVVEIAPEVVAAVGIRPVEEGFTVLNGVGGSAVHVRVRAAGRRADPSAGWRVVLDHCRDRPDDHAYVDPRVVRRDQLAAWVGSGAIVLCTRATDLAPRRLSALLAHELGHVLGLGHLCQGAACRHSGRTSDPCGYMFPSAHPCQDPASVADVVAALYPAPSPDRRSPGDGDRTAWSSPSEEAAARASAPATAAPPATA